GIPRGSSTKLLFLRICVSECAVTGAYARNSTSSAAAVPLLATTSGLRQPRSQTAAHGLVSPPLRG
ncbi:MAG: hypothetical protein ACRDZO_24550, partial [Egibacteraceae bacterium]